MVITGGMGAWNDITVVTYIQFLTYIPDLHSHSCLNLQRRTAVLLAPTQRYKKSQSTLLLVVLIELRVD